MKAYKLLRKLSDGNLYPLFIHKTYSTPINEWMQSEIIQWNVKYGEVAS